MKNYQATLNLDTSGSLDILDITRAVADELSKSQISDGLLTLFIPGSTAALTTIEYESGAINDLKKAIERLAPSAASYEHDKRWGDGNGFSHVRAALLGPSLTIPVREDNLTLGTWQQIVFIELDTRSRNRKIILNIAGK